MKLSVVIPAHNEEGSIEPTVRDLITVLNDKNIEHEILVINDHSQDQTESCLRRLREKHPGLRYLNNPGHPGFGSAVCFGLNHFSGDAVAVYMADASDNAEDLVRFFEALNRRGVDCIFGTRFHRDSTVTDYPRPKLILNRLANKFIQILFGLSYNDVTNAFKLYRRDVIQGLKPFLSRHFNLTVELPLKAIVRGYSFLVIPNDWTNRAHGVSKLKIKEMGSRYLFIILYCFIEKWLSRGDFHRSTQPTTPIFLPDSVEA